MALWQHLNDNAVLLCGKVSHSLRYNVQVKINSLSFRPTQKTNIFRVMTVHTGHWNFKLTTRSVMVYAAGGVVSPTGWWVTAPTLRTPASLNTQRDRASASSMFPVCWCLTKTTARRGVFQPYATKHESRPPLMGCSFCHYRFCSRIDQYFTICL